jgi:glycogen debranching enzyme
MKHILYLLAFLTGVCHGVGQEARSNGPIRVGVIGNMVKPGQDSEVVRCVSFLSGVQGIRATAFPREDLHKNPKALQQFDVLWIQRTDTSRFSSEETDPGLAENLKSYLENGGTLFLTQEAFRYINILGLEKAVPESRTKACIDEGNGRKLGFHSFRSHPVFDGLNGGAYIQVPLTDTAVRVTGYFEDHLPQEGKVVAVDWDYIFLRESSKLVLEYESGKGKVIAAGAYVDFSSRNSNYLQLHRFVENCIRYLASHSQAPAAEFWYFGPHTVTLCPEKPQDSDRMFLAIPPANPWVEETSPLSFKDRKSTGNPFDLAGARMVIMGREQSGIEEIWTHPFMALRDYEAGIQGTSAIQWLSTMESLITVTPSGFERVYKWKGNTLREFIAADPREPSGVVHYQYTGRDGIELVIRFRSNLRFMWPYSEKSIGTLCYGWDNDYNAFRVQDQSGGLVLLAGANRMPTAHRAGQADTNFIVTAEVSYSLNASDQLDFVITGTSEGLNKALFAYDRAIRDPMKIRSDATSHADSVLSESLTITTPNDTFNQGYLWSLIGTDRFFVYTPGMGSSLVAGYSTTRHGWDGGQKVNGRPGYAWYFGRDGEWSGMALLDYGDFEKVRQELLFYEKYQDLQGKIFHEATTSGVIHYDAADATPLYIVLAGRYFRYSNDTSYLKGSWNRIKKAINFCFSTDTDRDHLIENTNVGHGWVEGGELYGSHATLYLNACWAAALTEAAVMARAAGDAEGESYQQETQQVRMIINRDFWISSPALGSAGRETGYYSYGMNKDRTFRKEVTVLPAVPVYFGLADPLKAASMLGYYAGNRFTTNWGTRIIGDDSPLFKPTGYHYGSVWPLFTGWTALAEYKSGLPLQGFSHLMDNLNVYRNWALGSVEEVLNGAVYQPSGVCPHQCWSETMVVQPAIEGLLGLDVNAPENRISLAPRLPANWDSLTVRHIRIGGRHLDFSFRREGKTCIYVFDPGEGGSLDVSFLPSFPPATRIGKAYRDGKEITLAIFRTANQTSVAYNFTIQKKSILTFQADRGISMLPVLENPSPGDSAKGIRILATRWSGNTYVVDIEGPTGTTGDFYLRLLNGTQPTKIVHSDFFMTGKDTAMLRVKFDGSGTRYTTKTVTIETLP